MNAQQILIIAALLGGLLGGWYPTRAHYVAANNKRIAEEAIAVTKARDAADKQRQETSDAWARNLEQIIADKDAFARCVAAGKCGAVVRVLPSTSCQPSALPPPGRIDDPGSGAVPAPAGDPAPTVESAIAGLIDDCKKAIGMANALQADIEKQPGYR